MQQTKEGILIDVYFNEGIWFSIRENNDTKNDYFIDYSPYFYLCSKKELIQKDFDLIKNNLKGLEEIVKTEKQNAIFTYKLMFDSIESLISSREHIFKYDLNLSINYSLKEYDVPFLHRFFIDNKISNFKKIKFTCDSKKLLSFELSEDVPIDKLSYLTYDIEVLNTNAKVFPTPNKNKIISISTIDQDKKENVFFLINNLNLESTRKDLDKKLPNINLHLFTDENKLIDSFASFVGQADPDLLLTYNGDNFDFDYLFKRYKLLAVNDLTFGERKLHFHNRGKKHVTIDGIVHLDVYVLIRLLNYLQVFNFSKFDLTTVYNSLTSNKKLELSPQEMMDSYSNEDYEKIIIYNLDDVRATQLLGIDYCDIVNEISKLVHSAFSEILRSSAGSMVEKWFINHYIDNNYLIPNKPTQEEVSERYRYAFEGAFVKKPLPGLHKNLAIVDFRSYHISLIISYNISPETIDIDSDKEHYEVLGHNIYKQPKGFVPSLLEKMLDLRIPLKKKVKTLDKNTIEYKTLYARQYALKILLASTYGYMGFSGARWYCRNCLNIMYHLVRTKIQETIKSFEDKGYTVVYGDTDSCFVHFENLNNLKKDLEQINSSLPGAMALEMEDIFKTGIFVYSRDKEKAAKKKYALLKESGELKIKGFEYVRRDWAPLVKDTQKKVLEIVLSKESPKEAVSFVKDVIKDIKSKKIPKEKLIIQSFVRKNIDSYKSINPAMSALQKAKKRGEDVKEKEVIEYIITDKNTKTISEKSELVEYVKNGDYDVDYYINNQLIPAIYPILEVFDISKDELLTGQRQRGLKDYF